ncbi:MAG: hypothetical protein ACT6Q5_09490 [Sphingopyxis solisilvae]|uniref:hypothetical protein n=1 Tax=Sphingopyxis solisilvae TaxID=1886788 RepID=UPI0040373797
MNNLTTQPIDDDEPFCQGDVILRTSSEIEGNFEAYLIITADCDIAQRKMGNSFTVLPVRKVSDYIRYDWAEAQLEKILFDLTVKVSRVLQGIRPEEAENIDGVDVQEWISRRGSESIISTFDINEKSESYKHCTAIERVVRRKEYSALPLNVLDDVWNILGKAEKFKKSQVKDALSRKTISSHIQIVVDIMDRRYDIGYYVNLREVKAIPHSQCFKNHTDLRIEGCEGGFYRVSRLSDALKYLIVQKFANLFSRIGMDEWLEHEHDALAELLPDSFLMNEVAS